MKNDEKACAHNTTQKKKTPSNTYPQGNKLDTGNSNAWTD